MNNLKKTLALMAALAMTATAFVGCGDDSSSSTSEDSSSVSESEAESSEEESEEVSEEASDEESEEEDSEAAESTGAPTPDGTLGEGGDTLTVLCWTDTDLNAMFDVTSVDNIAYQNVGSNGTEANEQYTQYFSSGSDVDLFVCDADWVMNYEEDDTQTAPLSALGIDESMYSDAYGYTVAIGTNSAGVLKGASWQAAAGGYCYRTDLAEEYLGVTTPDEMQALIGDWDSFWSTAATVYEASEGTTAMADTLAGVWRAYSAGNRTTPWVVDGTFNSEAVNDFIPMAKDAYDNGYITSAEQWTDDWYLLGQSEGALANATFGYFYPSWSLATGGQLESSEGGEGGSTYGQYAITAGPTGWFWGGSWLCVSPNTDNATEAAQFIYDVTINPDTMKEYALAHSDFVNNKTVMAEIVADGSNQNPLFKDSQDQFAALADSADKINLDGIAGQYDGTINDAFVSAVLAYCKGDLASEEDCTNNFLDTVATALPDIVVD
jgi:ABC-type glycerol-3-phosphate transport system substrate-binding protein